MKEYIEEKVQMAIQGQKRIGKVKPLKNLFTPTDVMCLCIYSAAAERKTFERDGGKKEIFCITYCRALDLLSFRCSLNGILSHPCCKNMHLTYRDHLLHTSTQAYSVT